LCEIFNILIVSAVKVCKQCLQTASASGDDRGFAPGPHWGLSSPDPLGYSPNTKIPGAARNFYENVFRASDILANENENKNENDFATKITMQFSRNKPKSPAV